MVTNNLEFIETSPPTKSLAFADISFITVPPVKVEPPPPPPVNATPPIMSEALDGINSRPPKETSEDTRTLELKLASPFKVEVPATYKREFSEVSPLAKSRPFRLISSETMSW